MSSSAPVNWNVNFIVSGFMAEKVKATLKRKSRKSSSISSESEIGSPDGKKIFISSFHTKLSEADISEGSLDDNSDQILKALKISDGIGEQLNQILVRLERMEMKMVKLEGVLDKISNLEKAVNTIQASMSSFNEKVKKMEKTIGQIEAGLTSTNVDIQAIGRKEKQTAGKIRSLEDQILYQDVYSRRENLRFFGIPEIHVWSLLTLKTIKMTPFDSLYRPDPTTYPFPFTCR